MDHDEAYEQQRAAKMGKPEESEVVLRGSISKEIVAKRYAVHNHQYLGESIPPISVKVNDTSGM